MRARRVGGRREQQEEVHTMTDATFSAGRRASLAGAARRDRRLRRRRLQQRRHADGRLAADAQHRGGCQRHELPAQHLSAARPAARPRQPAGGLSARRRVAHGRNGRRSSKPCALASIVIGIGNEAQRVARLRTRCNQCTLNGGGEGAFLDFIRFELIPFVEATFGGSAQKRVLLGHSHGGSFVLYALFAEANATRHFSAYLASDASIDCMRATVYAWESNYAAGHHDPAGAAAMCRMAAISANAGVRDPTRGARLHRAPAGGDAVQRRAHRHDPGRLFRCADLRAGRLIGPSSRLALRSAPPRDGAHFCRVESAKSPQSRRLSRG